ncbi:MAG: hypothetical protein JW760_12335 [Spirochaetales bacterium]|nr:hypothetical protein [Spirochaetales bacterium]
MKKQKTSGLYVLLAVLMALDIYSIFNAGNPASLFRYMIEDPGWDFLITSILSLSIVVVVILMNSRRTRTDDPIYMLLLQNKDYIEKLREKGKTDEEIALSFVEQLHTGRLAGKIAFRKALKHLKRI